MPRGVGGRTTCSVPDCSSFVVGHGFCDPHYRRYRRHGDPLVGGEIKRPIQYNGAACGIIGCGRPAQSLGWCKAHYNRWVKTGDVNAARPVGRACGVCLSPDRIGIEAAILSGEPSGTTAARVGVPAYTIQYHKVNHLHYKPGPGQPSCKVCDHPDLDEIEMRFIQGRVSRAQISRTFGVSESTLRQHFTPTHGDLLAAREAERLAAVLRWAAA